MSLQQLTTAVLVAVSGLTASAFAQKYEVSVLVGALSLAIKALIKGAMYPHNTVYFGNRFTFEVNPARRALGGQRCRNSTSIPGKAVSTTCLLALASFFISEAHHCLIQPHCLSAPACNCDKGLTPHFGPVAVISSYNSGNCPASPAESPKRADS
jgi:hypothetical protein